MALRRFAKSEIYISKHEAWTILRFFFGPQCTLRETELTDDDVNFAQGLLVEAIDASYAMGYAEILFKTFYGKVPGSFTDVQSIVKSFVKKAAQHWFKHLGKKELSKAEIYDSVRNTIVLNFGTIFATRQSTGEYTGAW